MKHIIITYSFEMTNSVLFELKDDLTNMTPETLKLITQYSWECPRCAEFKKMIYMQPKWETSINYDWIYIDTLVAHVFKNNISVFHQSRISSYNEDPKPYTNFAGKIPIDNFILSIVHNYPFEEVQNLHSISQSNHTNQPQKKSDPDHTIKTAFYKMIV